MCKKLKDIAQELINKNKKVQLIYGFNGTGKTRLSRAFKEEISPSPKTNRSDEAQDKTRNKFLYYNAFTEDLFYWDNDLESDAIPKLKIQPNTFTGWLIGLLQELGEDGNITSNFQRYTSSKATPIFNQQYETPLNNKLIKKIPAFSEITFQIASDEPLVYRTPIEESNNVVQGNYKAIKISKGEESNFVWSIMFTLLQQVVYTLNEEDITNRITDKFNNLEYIFIDDPVSSLDDSHLIELAVDLAYLIKSSVSDLKFIITTHNPLFYNVLCKEFNNPLHQKTESDKSKQIYFPKKVFKQYRLDKQADGNFELIEKPTDSQFSYHLFLLFELQKAIKNGEIRKYHFSFIRNILEKMATFLGYKEWSTFLPSSQDGARDAFIKRLLNASCHSAHAGEEIADLNDKDKDDLEELVNHLINTYGFNSEQLQ